LKDFATNGTAALVALGTFYALGLHALWFPVFRGAYVRAEVIETGKINTLNVFAGVNTVNLCIALALAMLTGILAPSAVSLGWRVFKLLIGRRVFAPRTRGWTGVKDVATAEPLPTVVLAGK